MSLSVPRKAVIYARVSGLKQVREGDGLNSQQTRCREHASYRGYEIVETFKDEVSGGLKDRPGMKAMLAHLKKHSRKGERYVVLIDDISRLARRVDAHIELRAAISMAGGDLESPSVEFGEDADSELHEFIMATVAQHQRRKNAEQTRNRMRARAMGGYWVTRAPIGYRYAQVAGHGKLLVRDEPLASIVAEGLNGYASGRFDSQVEVKRFFESQPAYPRNSNNEVHIERVNEMFSRPVYAGHISIPVWGLYLVPGKHEGLISLETWQTIQERRYGTAKAPARKDIHEDFPLRGFVTCNHRGMPYTAAWTRGRSAMYPYYLCDTRGCAAYRKSIRKADLEGAFEELLASLQPSEGLFSLAFEIFRDLWNAKVASVQAQSQTLVQDIRLIDKKVEQLLDRIVEATSESVIAAYEHKIKSLELEKAVTKERIAACGRPTASFGDTYRTAFDFLGNPCNLWHSPRLEDRRAVLKLVFAEKLSYAPGEGYRTAQISMPFKVLGDLKMDKKEMVRAVGLEPTYP